MSNLYAGTSKVDITPSASLYLSGYVLRLKPSVGVHDRLYAKALVLEDKESGTSAVLVAADLLGFSKESIDRMRSEITEKTGINSDGIIISCTHTHSAPATVKLRKAGDVDDGYLRSVESKIVDAVVKAQNSMVQVKVAAGKSEVKGIGFNRERKDGPIDEELGVIKFSSLDRGVLATILNYTCHPVVLGPKNLLVSADYPGVAARIVEEKVGGYCLFTTGADGDIDPLINKERWGEGTFKDVEEVGERIGLEAVNIINRLDGSEKVHLAVAQRKVRLPVEPPPSMNEAEREVEKWKEEVERLKKSGADPSKIRVAEAFLEWSRDVLENVARGTFPDSMLLEITMIGINDILLIAVPGELFVEIGLEVKRKSPFKFTYIVGYGNGELGYFPTAEAIRRGGYASRNAPKYFGITFLKPEAGRILESELTKMPKELYSTYKR